MSLTIPPLMPQPFASTTGGPNYGGANTIPVASASPLASLADGFPVATMKALASGGVPPAGADFNGILNWITEHMVWEQSGGRYVFNSTQATAIGGYALGAMLQSSVTPNIIWTSLQTGNLLNPDSGPFAITASCATNVLTVTATAQVLAIGQVIAGAGIPVGTAITSQLTGSAGSTGTYQLSTTPGTVAGESMTAFGWQSGSVNLNGNNAWTGTNDFTGGTIVVPVPTLAAQAMRKDYVDARFAVAARINGLAGITILEQVGVVTLGTVTHVGTGEWTIVIPGLTASSIVTGNTIPGSVVNGTGNPNGIISLVPTTNLLSIGAVTLAGAFFDVDFAFTVIKL